VPADRLVATLTGHLAAERLCLGALALVPEKLHDESFHFVAARTSLFLAHVRVNWVVVAAEELPVHLGNTPVAASPLSQDALTVQVPTNTLVFSPSPLGWLIEVVALPDLPVRPHVFPVAVPEATKDSPAVQVMPHALV